ncbi:MAG: ATP-binding protein [Coriobacteriia bacterium]|nr:ATP-binding protein [Coriobacteriia bacterium]
MTIQQKTTPRRGIRLKLAVFVGVLVVALMAINVLWNIDIQEQQSHHRARDKAELLLGGLQAVWFFMETNKDNNAVEAEGSGQRALVCVVASTSSSTLSSPESDYIIRYVDQVSHQQTRAPDSFEADAFKSFMYSSAADYNAFYGVDTTDEGNRVFRYVEPLFVTESCLKCHSNTPQNVLRQGFVANEMNVGDVRGALSIIEPMDIYAEGIRASVLQQLFMVLLILAVASITNYFAVSRVVLQPLDKIRQVAKRMGRGGEGRFDYSLDIKGLGGPDELTEFAEDFDIMARQLQQLYTDLEGEVLSQTNKLSILNEQLLSQKSELEETLKQLNEETAYKNDFFAIMSHELRTPLTSILAFTRILEEDVDLDRDTIHALREIETSALLLLNMVNNILTISKAEAHKDTLILEPVDFVDLVGVVRNSLGQLAKNQGIKLSVKAEADVPVSMADCEKLRRIIENLVNNAIKYTPNDGMIDVYVHFVPVTDEATEESVRFITSGEFSAGAIVIDVTDDGMGIRKEDQESIFDKYQQAKQSPSQRQRGSGLGLAVVKELTSQHGGTVKLKSVVGEGSTFTVCIPYVPVKMEEDDEDTAS